MKESYIEFEQNQENQLPRKKKFSWRRIILYLIVIIILVAIFFLYDLFSSGKSLSESLGQVSIWQQIRHLIASEDKKLTGEEDDRINTLILGVGGPNHEGPYLTDTIILASYKPSTNEAALVSIPRDLVVPLPGYGWYKINHANAYAEAKEPGSGGRYTSRVISSVFDIPVHYYVIIDFEGFVKIIDDLGGIVVDVENSFDDYKYPIPGMETATTTERYEHLHFDAGRQYMDGQQALKFARSRFAEGPEGSDFARARRQQKVILAIKDKIFSWQTLVNPYKISKTLENIGNHIKTNMEVWEIYNLYKLSNDLPSENIKHVILDDSPTGYLVADITTDGAFILKPKTGDYLELQQLAKNIFQTKVEEPKKKIAPAVIEPVLSLEIQNGTRVNGLAARTSVKLENEGFKVIAIGNAKKQNYNKTFIYDLSPQIEKTKTLESLENILQASTSSTTPEWLKSSQAVNPLADILIILGLDQVE